MQYKKYKNQAGMNLTPPAPSQNSHAVRWHCIAESERSRSNKKVIFMQRLTCVGHKDDESQALTCDCGY